MTTTITVKMGCSEHERPWHLPIGVTFEEGRITPEQAVKEIGWHMGQALRKHFVEEHGPA